MTVPEMVAPRPGRTDVVGPKRRRRRPSGEPPPLPRPIFRSGRIYVVLTLMLVVVWTLAATVPPVASTVDRFDHAVLGALERARVDAVTDAALGLGFLGSSWPWRVARWTTLALLLATRRLRHFLVYAGMLLAVTAITTAVLERAQRLPPSDVEILGAAERYVHPSRPVVSMGLTLVGAMYTLLPKGRVRNRVKLIAAAVMALLVGSRLYLAQDHPSDAAVALILGMAVPVVAFRFLTPHEIFPISYGPRRAPTLGPARLRAIGDALGAAFGWTVVQVTALRPPGSSGSTPLFVTVDAGDGEELDVFAKLYALAHVRSDRWYKFGRTILYGRLEDEAPFASVRQLVEHEDYMLRLASAAGLPVPATYGFVELTPAREYLLVMERLPEDRQVGPGIVSEQVIDDALMCVRQMWDAGIAHRDIKPANLVVARDGVYLVDLSFAEVRATPWREAVDLATMMLTLGLFAPARDVYERALRLFDPDEIGEAFAAARSVTIPSQLRSLIRLHAPDLADQFRRLAPPHRPISIQRWSMQRVLLSGVVALLVCSAAALLIFNLETAGLL